MVEEALPITICLQEMMTNRTDHLLKNNYEWITCSRPESLGNGIAGLGIRKDIQFHAIQHNSDLHACAARIGKPWNITVVSIYVPHNLNNQELIGKLKDLLDTLEPPYLLCGDFNASHEVWGSCQSNQRGRKLLEWAVENNLLVLNNGSPTHYHCT